MTIYTTPEAIEFLKITTWFVLGAGFASMLNNFRK